jgi:HSP20 family protein
MAKTYGPLLEIARIQTEINKLFESLFELKTKKDYKESVWIPSVDICECEEYVIVKVEVPGISGKDLKLYADGSNITVEGVKKKLTIDGKKKLHLMERDYGKFRRVVNVNAAVNTHKAEAVLRDGVLRLVFPKVSNKRGERIMISVSEA